MRLSIAVLVCRFSRPCLSPSPPLLADLCRAWRSSHVGYLHLRSSVSCWPFVLALARLELVICICARPSRVGHLYLHLFV